MRSIRRVHKSREPAHKMVCTMVRGGRHCQQLLNYRPQAEKLDEMLQHRGAGIDKVLSFEVPDSVLVSRRPDAVPACCASFITKRSGPHYCYDKEAATDGHVNNQQ